MMFRLISMNFRGLTSHGGAHQPKPARQFAQDLFV